MFWRDLCTCSVSSIIFYFTSFALTDFCSHGIWPINVWTGKKYISMVFWLIKRQRSFRIITWSVCTFSCHWCPTKASTTSSGIEAKNSTHCINAMLCMFNALTRRDSMEVVYDLARSVVPVTPQFICVDLLQTLKQLVLGLQMSKRKKKACTSFSFGKSHSCMGCV